MSNFEFKQVSQLTKEDDLSHHFFIWVWHADKIPPHVGCSMNGLYYSLKSKGKDDGLEYKTALNLIHSKFIPSFIIQVKCDASIAGVKNVFDNYTKIEVNKNTCLSPIIELFEIETPIGQLSELLNYLDAQKRLETVFGLNLDEGNNSLREYSSIDIQNRLLTLENAKIKTDSPKIG